MFQTGWNTFWDTATHQCHQWCSISYHMKRSLFFRLQNCHPRGTNDFPRAELDDPLQMWCLSRPKSLNNHLEEDAWQLFVYSNLDLLTIFFMTSKEFLTSPCLSVQFSNYSSTYLNNLSRFILSVVINKLVGLMLSCQLNFLKASLKRRHQGHHRWETLAFLCWTGYGAPFLGIFTVAICNIAVLRDSSLWMLWVLPAWLPPWEISKRRGNFSPFLCWK